MFKKSLFVISTPINGCVLLYNTQNGFLIELDAQEWFIWEKDVNRLNAGLLKQLMSMDFIVDSNLDEFEQYKNKVFDNVPLPQRDCYKIMTTSDCNANCFYCFEKKCNTDVMDYKTADCVINYIDNNSRTHNVELKWFGGEPLLNHNIITYIVENLEKKPNIESVCSSIVTNGSLFNDKLIDIAKSKWHLDQVQITLDGTESNHNRIKKYRDCENGFKQTLDNVERLLKQDISVNLRINYTQYNVNDVLSVVDLIFQRFENRVSVYFAPIFGLKNNPEEDLLYTIEKKLLNKLLDYNYASLESILHVKKHNCGLTTFDNYAVISPSGKVYKCAESMYLSNLSLFDDVHNSHPNINIIKLWMEKNVRDECKTCAYYPLCLGGCKADQMGIIDMKCFRYKTQIKDVIVQLYNNNLKSLDHNSA